MSPVSASTTVSSPDPGSRSHRGGAPAQAAALMGPAYSDASILALIDLGAVDTKAGAVLLIDKGSLYEYREALWEVLTDER